jgi:hypothetical protein
MKRVLSEGAVRDVALCSSCHNYVLLVGNRDSSIGITTGLIDRSKIRSSLSCRGKVKHTLVQALRLCTGRTAHAGSRCIALPFLDHGTRRG